MENASYILNEGRKSFQETNEQCRSTMERFDVEEALDGDDRK